MAIRKVINKDKPDFAGQTCLNVEASASIPVGTPVIFKMAADVNDGIGVILPSSSTAVKATSLFGGVLLRTLTAGERGDMLTSGFCLTGLYSRGTRASTTSAWPSFVAIALGDVLTLDTVANAFGYSTVGAAATGTPAFVIADNGTAITAASTTTATSSAYTQWSTATAATILMKMLIRNM